MLVRGGGVLGREGRATPHGLQPVASRRKTGMPARMLRETRGETWPRAPRKSGGVDSQRYFLAPARALHISPALSPAPAPSPPHPPALRLPPPPRKLVCRGQRDEGDAYMGASEQRAPQPAGASCEREWIEVWLWVTVLCLLDREHVSLQARLLGALGDFRECHAPRCGDEPRGAERSQCGVLIARLPSRCLPSRCLPSRCRALPSPFMLPLGSRPSSHAWHAVLGDWARREEDGEKRATRGGGMQWKTRTKAYTLASSFTSNT